MKTKKGRDENNQFLIEGEKFIFEIPYDFKIDYFIISEFFANKNDLAIYKNKSIVYIVKDNIYKSLSDTITPQGIMAICQKKNYSIKDINFKTSASFFLLAENLQDPGNLGTLIRTADACNVDYIILSKNSVDIYNPKVLRSTAGSIFHIPVIQNADLDEIFNLFREHNIKTLAAHLHGDKTPYDVNLTESIAILLGNEGQGLSDTISKKADYLVKIPMLGKAESLNASIASGVLLYEVVRQRISKK